MVAAPVCGLLSCLFLCAVLAALATWPRRSDVGSGPSIIGCKRPVHALSVRAEMRQHRDISWIAVVATTAGWERPDAQIARRLS